MIIRPAWALVAIDVALAVGTLGCATNGEPERPQPGLRDADLEPDDAATAEDSPSMPADASSEGGDATRAVDSGSEGDAEPRGEPDRGPPQLPCEVRAVLAKRCVHCHSSPPSAGAVLSLLSRRDFQLPSPSIPVASVAHVSLMRLHDVAAPMPPRSEPDTPAAELEVLTKWIDEGTPPGACDPLPAKPISVTCSSTTFWDRGNEARLSMNPGRPCRTCHMELEPERAYYFSGTVYSSFHEADLCNGVVPPATRVEILDANGVVQLSLPLDAVGNFASGSVEPGVPLPYRARIVSTGGVREMTTAQVDGDCNKCHSEQGAANTPGRIVVP